jgi:hypothetical protein
MKHLKYFSLFESIYEFNDNLENSDLQSDIKYILVELSDIGFNIKIWDERHNNDGSEMYIEISHISDLDVLEDVLKRVDEFCNQEGFDLIIKEQLNKGREKIVNIDDTISNLKSQLYRNTQSEHMRLHPDTSVTLYINRK